MILVFIGQVQPWFGVLPHVNASLNACSGVLLLLGLILIKRGHQTAHQRMMLSACGVSLLFLISYLTYHTLRQMADGVGHTKWEIDGLIRWFYYGVLLSHVLLAATVPVLAVMTVRLGLKKRWDRHKKWARWTWPIWMYVSVTGVLVYLLLYWVQPALR